MRMSRVSYLGYSTQYLGALQEAEQLRRDANRVYPIWSRNACMTSGQVEGDRRVIAMEQMLESFGVKRRDIQKEMHAAIINAMLPMIYGADWEAVRARVLKERNVKDVRRWILVKMPRQMGKSTSLAMMIATVLDIMPEFAIIVVSSNLEAAQMLVAMVHTMYERLSFKKVTTKSIRRFSVHHNNRKTTDNYVLAVANNEGVRVPALSPARPHPVQIYARRFSVLGAPASVFFPG